MVPPEGMAVAGVNATVIDTGDLPTMRSEEAMLTETDETTEAIPPDDSTFEILHVFARNAMPTESVVAEPIVKPLMVTVNADAGMAAPEIVIATAVAVVGPHMADKPATLLASEGTEGTTEEAKKLEGYKRVKVLPERNEADEEKTRVAETDDFATTRSIEEMSKEENEMPIQPFTSHRE